MSLKESVELIDHGFSLTFRHDLIVFKCKLRIHSNKKKRVSKKGTLMFNRVKLNTVMGKNYLPNRVKST